MRPIEPRQRDALPTPGAAPRVLDRAPDLILVDKPAGWAGAPTAGVPDVLGALAVEAALPRALDVDATGLLPLCLDGAATARVVGAEAAYLAVVDGHPPTRGRLAGADCDFTRLAAGSTWSLLRLSTQASVPPIRARLAASGWPVRGDARFGDPLDRRAPRALLHRAELRVGGRHFVAPPPPDFAPYAGGDARAGLAEDPDTTCWRVWNGADEGRPACVDRYAGWLWVQGEAPELPADLPAADGIYQVVAQVDRSRGAQPTPRHVAGRPAPAPLTVFEHGVAYLVELGEQLSTGLFLDQRPQRAWLARHAGGRRVLNTFAHAGGYSVAAAVAGAETKSVDLSRRWLARVAPQLAANGIDPARHDTIYGDVFDWLRRLGARGERFDVVILDPPSTSVGKRKKRWSAAKDYGELVALALPLLAPGAELWTATNHRKTPPQHFAARVAGALPSHIDLERVCPPAVDFPCDGPAPVKTLVWKDRR